MRKLLVSTEALVMVISNSRGYDSTFCPHEVCAFPLLIAFK